MPAARSLIVPRSLIMLADPQVLWLVFHVKQPVPPPRIPRSAVHLWRRARNMFHVKQRPLPSWVPARRRAGNQPGHPWRGGRPRAGHAGSPPHLRARPAHRPGISGSAWPSISKAGRPRVNTAIPGREVKDIR